jgi:hypothetical protein
MKNNYDGSTTFVFAAFDAEAHADNEGGAYLFEIKDVAWIIRVGAQRLPKNYAIGYILTTNRRTHALPTPVAERVPDLPDEVVAQMHIVANGLQFMRRYGSSSKDVIAEVTKAYS